MKPWREIAVPHRDVLEGTFQQSEFAADITAVTLARPAANIRTPPRSSTAPSSPRECACCSRRSPSAWRQGRRAGHPAADGVRRRQDAHHAGRLSPGHAKCALSDLAGIPALIERAGLMDVPQARVAVIDGTAHAPGQPWKHGSTDDQDAVGRAGLAARRQRGFALVKEADATGTSPGKDVLRELLERYAPCVVLIDELVAYIRQFPEGQALSGGSYDSNLSFVQALTEAVKLVPTGDRAGIAARVRCRSGQPARRGSTAGTGKDLRPGAGALEAGGDGRGIRDRPAAACSSRCATTRPRRGLPRVRRRLHRRRCQAARRDTGGALLRPADAGVSDPPEVFDRLYEDWTTIDGFQRTRGVLKLMAKVIYRLWKDDNKDLMILPGSLPLHDGRRRNELTYYLPAGWDPVIERDIDGDRAETTELENKEPRFGQVNAARRVARTLFLGSAPSSVATKAGIRGLDRARVLLGCLQPGQAIASTPTR